MEKVSEAARGEHNITALRSALKFLLSKDHKISAAGHTAR